MITFSLRIKLTKLELTYFSKLFTCLNLNLSRIDTIRKVIVFSINIVFKIKF